MVTSADCIKKYGIPYDRTETTVNENSLFEGKHMKLVDTPLYIQQNIPVIPKRIYCNRDLEFPLIHGLTNVIAQNLQHEIKTWDGCFNIRPKRGLNSLSLHSWGIAFDINAAWNQLGKIPTMSKELVNCFVLAGFDWGGEWIRRDGMHFQLKTLEPFK